MKNTIILFVLALGLSLSGCSTYYYAAVNSFENRLPSNEDGSYSSEKNNVVVTYSFVNLNGDVVYEIFNESDDPVYVDWNKSVLVTEDLVAGNKNLPKNTTTYQFSNDQQMIEDETGEYVHVPQNTLFVPPHSRAGHSPIALGDIYNMKSPRVKYGTVNIGETKLKGLYYNPENSPLVFRSYLTIVNDRDKSETVFEDMFFISKAFKTVSKNNFLMNMMKNRGDMFYTSEINKAGKTLTWIGLIGLIAVGAAFAPEEYIENPDYY